MLRYALLAFVATLVALSAGASAAALFKVDARAANVGIAIEALDTTVAADAIDAPLPQLADLALPARPLVDATLPLSAAHPAVPVIPELPIARPSTPTLDPREPAEPVPASVQAAAATGLFWLIVERLGFGRALVGALAALYFRVQPNELLDHERRERVVQLVRERPGIGPQDVAHALGTGWGVTSYHLDRLERAGLVTSQRVGQHRCYFLPGAIPREAQRAVGLFRGETTRRLAELVATKPGLTQSQLCAELGLSPSAASKQLSRLEAAALVRRETSAAGQRVFPLPMLAGALVPAS